MTSNMIAMEDCTTVNGVFLHTKNLDSELMLRCLQTLLNNFPEIKFSSVTTDEKHLGYRVHFSCPEMDEVLAKKHLSVSGQNIRICPLTACLTIHSINLSGNLHLDTDIREAIKNRFGKLLYVVKIPGSPDRRNENIKNWRVYIDVPEIKGLEIFDHEGFPDMCMWLANKKEKLKVTFYCRRCKKDGHIQEDCHPTIQTEASTTEKELNSNDSKSLAANLVKPFDISLEPTETYAEKIGREEIMKTGILSEKHQKYKEAEPNKSIPEGKEFLRSKLMSLDLASVTIKNEVEETNDIHFEMKPQNTEGDDNKRIPKEEPHDNQNNHSISSNDDDIQLIEYRDTSNSSDSHFFKSSGKTKAEDTGSFRNQTISTGLPFSSSSATPGPSNMNYGIPKPSIAVEVTSVLSDRLQDFINSACNKFRILDRQTLDAFLTHVKKKSNPIRVASNYTKDALGLKKQLQHILTLYYTAPKEGAKEDISFIKWLNGLVERFEGTVSRKRRRSTKDDSPNKK